MLSEPAQHAPEPVLGLRGSVAVPASRSATPHPETTAGAAERQRPRPRAPQRGTCWAAAWGLQALVTLPIPCPQGTRCGLGVISCSSSSMNSLGSLLNMVRVLGGENG